MVWQTRITAEGGRPAGNRHSDSNGVGASLQTVMTGESWLDLTCHPSTHTEAVRAIGVLVRRTASAELQMTFRLDGDIPRVSVPPPGVSAIRWRSLAAHLLRGLHHGGRTSGVSRVQLRAVGENGPSMHFAGIAVAVRLLTKFCARTLRSAPLAVGSSSTHSSASIVCPRSTRLLRSVSGSRRSSRQAMGCRTGRFAIRRTTGFS